MGTQGSYGGTGGQKWREVRTRFDDLPPDDINDVPRDDSDSDADGDGDDGQPDRALVDLGQALANALAADDVIVAQPPSSGYPLPSILPRRRGSGGGGGGGTGGVGGGIRGGSSGTGRVRASSKRSVARSAARGGAALGAGYALRSGDREALAGIGLDLDELQTLRPLTQCFRILDAVLGEGGHPDEAALRAATAAQLKAIVLTDNPPSTQVSLRGFISAFVFQLALVELRSQIAAGTLDAAVASRKERRLRRYIERRVRQVEMPVTGALSIAEFSSHADRLSRDAIAVLRAR